MEVIDEIVAKNVLGQDAAVDQTRSRENFRNTVVLFREAFPDAEYPLFDLVGEDDKVVARWGLRGTHRGVFMGVSPTGKTVRVDGIIIYRLKDEKIVEYWGSFDTLGLMQQLGVAKLHG